MKAFTQFNENGFWHNNFKKCVLFFCLKEQMKSFYWKHKIIKVSLYAELYEHAKGYINCWSIDFGEYLSQQKDIDYMLNIIKLTRKHLKKNKIIVMEIRGDRTIIESKDILPSLGALEQLLKGKLQKGFKCYIK